MPASNDHSKALTKTLTKPLTKTRLRKAARELAKQDEHFDAVLAEHGYPPLWDRPPSFGTLVHMVLEQQVSLASAQAAFDKLTEAAPDLTPQRFLKLSDAKLKSIGFSHQKTSYCRGIADSLLDGSLDLTALDKLSDDEAEAKLTALRGIGPWTACVYLMMVLLRPDVWPNGDRALAVGTQELFQLAEVPSYPELEEMARAWAPYRSVAARLIWHRYLKQRGK